MGVEVKVTINPAVAVQLTAATSRGLMQAGEYLLAAAYLRAPVESGEPRHGVHGRDTGFSRLEAGGSGGDRVAIGYEAFWMVWQHEKTEYEHEHGEAKWLEKTMLEEGNSALEMVAAVMREALAS